MREIKFRIWLPEHNQFVYPHICDFIRGGGNNVIGRIDPCFKYEKGLKFNVLFVHSNFDKNQMGEVNDHIDNIEHVIQQFTGLYDKNKKEIYEGDIVKCIVEGRNYEIKYGKAKFYPVLLDTIATHGYEYDWEYWYDECSEKEVVGNIFENPELLQKLS